MNTDIHILSDSLKLSNYSGLNEGHLPSSSYSKYTYYELLIEEYQYQQILVIRLNANTQKINYKCHWNRLDPTTKGPFVASILEEIEVSEELYQENTNCKREALLEYGLQHVYDSIPKQIQQLLHHLNS